MTANAIEFDGAAATDEQLLQRFRDDRDECAFAELVRRNGTMVFGVARQMLGCQHAAEDVFQATFLVLARDAKRIRNRQAVASWLYGVAYRISARLAGQRAKQAVTLKDEPMVTSDPFQEVSERIEQQTIHDELHRLPDKLRTAMVLRYLQGKSNVEVAEALNLSESAVEGRLKRGRNQLRIRLARQGIGFVVAVAALEVMHDQAANACPPALASKTVSACLSSDPTFRAELIGDTATQLAEREVMNMMTTSLTKTAFVSSFAFVGCFAIGAIALGWAVLPAWRGAQADEVASESGQVVVAETTLLVENPPAVNIVQATDRPTFLDQVKDMQSPRFDLKSRTPAEEKILTTLKEKTRLEFVDAPLAEVIDFLQDFHDIPIEVDAMALQDLAIDVASEAITKDLSEISLRSGLELLLRDLNLTCVIRHEVLLITSLEAAEGFVETRVYRMPSERTDAELDRLLDIITGSIAPESWEEVGGPGFIDSLDGGLVVLQTQQVHGEINAFLAQLERLRAGVAR